MGFDLGMHLAMGCWVWVYWCGVGMSVVIGMGGYCFGVGMGVFMGIGCGVIGLVWGWV